MSKRTNQELYDFNKGLLETIYESRGSKVVQTLAMMLTGVIIGQHVQLWMIAINLPLAIQLSSIVRRFERFLADPSINVKVYFEPFVWAMHASLGREIAYVILDCTQAGPKCRTLLAGLVYHGTVLPLAWKTYQGSKGHLTAENHRALLVELLPYLQHHHQVIVLGDAEFSSQPLIAWCRTNRWDFVFRFQHRYQVQLEHDGDWATMKAVYEQVGLQSGQVMHWEQASFTAKHQLRNCTLTVHWGDGEDEPICLVSSLDAALNPHLIYELRASIETLFGNHKSRGFQFARTQMTNPEHIDRLFLVLAIATCMMLGLGTHLFIIGRSKVVDRSERRDLSLFQLGYRYLLRLLALDRLHDFKMYFRWDFKLPPPGFQKA